MRVIGPTGQQLGILALSEAINLARANQMDLVEIAPNATPPVCRVVDFGKFRYEQSKKDKESKKHQHANKVKEIQLSATIDPHDFGVKVAHAIDFLCEEMKVKVTLRFRGREMAHQEFGYQVVNNFIKETGPYGHPDAPPKLIGKGINVMFSPLPRNKRAKNPRGEGSPALPPMKEDEHFDDDDHVEEPVEDDKAKGKVPVIPEGGKPADKPGGFNNNPFAQLNVRGQ